jgi:hypothetical protein
MVVLRWANGCGDDFRLQFQTLVLQGDYGLLRGCVGEQGAIAFGGLRSKAASNCGLMAIGIDT